MEMQRKVLIVDNDRDMTHLVEMYLLDLGYQVDIEAAGTSGLQRVENEAYDLIVVEQNLPGINGLDICRRLRARQNKAPILILTALVGERERVCCLEAGADDFVVKPFSILELVARINAILRCATDTPLRRATDMPPVNGKDLIRHDDLEIDLQRHQVAIGGKRVDLTAKEFSLLRCLATNPGRVYSRTQLVDLVWGNAYDGFDHTVHSHINRLRTKIETNPAKPMRILTIRNVGYKFHEKASAN